jgi:hypothetical protein
VEQQAHPEHEPKLHVDAGAVVSSLQIVCAWCQQHIVWHRVQIPMPFQISYSICPRCYADVSREFEPLTAGPYSSLACVPRDRPERASARSACQRAGYWP